MKMSLNNIKRLVVIAIVSACAFVSCVQVEEHGAAVGYLAAPSLEVDVVVDDLMQTKALDFEIEAPEISEIRFVVKDKDGNTKYDDVDFWGEPLVLPVGAYTIEATHGVNGFDAPYFKGSFSGTISALDRQTPTLSVALANSLVSVNVSDDLAKHFIKGGKISLNSGAFEAAYGEWFYVPSGADLSLELTGTNSAGKPATLSYTLAAPSPKVAYSITCGTESTDWPSISLSLSNDDIWASRIYITTPASFSGNISAENQAAVVYEAIPSSSSDWTDPAIAVSENGVLVIKELTSGTEYQVRARVGALVSPVVKVTPMIDGLSATAEHTYTDGELDGTDVTSVFSKSAAVKNAINSWTVNICKADGTVLRKTTLGTSEGSSLTGITDWPYLPVGDYKVTLSATMSDGEVITPEDLSFSTEKPTVTVTAAGKTTYDYAQARDLNNANAVLGSHTANASVPSQSLFEIGASISISPNLMDNTNYSKTVYYAVYKDSELVIATDGYVDYGTSKTHYLGDVYDTFTDWRSYLLSVKVNFAGTEYEGARTFHITGLPYTAAPPKNTGEHSWSNTSGSGISWESSYVLLTSSAGSPCISSPVFYIPSSIDVQVLSQVYRNNFYTVGSNRFKIYVGNTDHCVVDENLSRKSTTDIDKNSTMTNSLNQWFISYSYSVVGPEHEIYNFSLKYR